MIHNNLKEAREAASISQRALASSLGCGQSQVSRIESGGNTTIDFAQKIAEILTAGSLDALWPSGEAVEVVVDDKKASKSTTRKPLKKNTKKAARKQSKKITK